MRPKRRVVDEVGAKSGASELEMACSRRRNDDHVARERDFKFFVSIMSRI